MQINSLYIFIDNNNDILFPEHEKKKGEIHNFIDGWKSAWQSKSIDQYMDFYDIDFNCAKFSVEEMIEVIMKVAVMKSLLS